MGNRGFTFIEIILVIVIMGIAIPALVSAVAFITQSQVNPMGTTVATTLAQERMEEIIADKMNSVVPFTSINNARYPNDTPRQGYTRSVNIICVSAPPNLDVDAGCNTNYRRAQVTVQAAGIGPSVPDAVLVTVLTNY